MNNLEKKTKNKELETFWLLGGTWDMRLQVWEITGFEIPAPHTACCVSPTVCCVPHCLLLCPPTLSAVDLPLSAVLVVVTPPPHCLLSWLWLLHPLSPVCCRGCRCIPEFLADWRNLVRSTFLFFLSASRSWTTSKCIATKFFYILQIHFKNLF